MESSSEVLCVRRTELMANVSKPLEERDDLRPVPGGELIKKIEERNSPIGLLEQAQIDLRHGESPQSSLGIVTK